MKNKRNQWLITGVAGFIGSSFGRYVLEQGDSVVGLDNFISGQQKNIDNLQRIGKERFRFFEGDICDPEIVGQAASDCHFAVHLAAIVSVQKSIANPEQTNTVNIKGFQSTYNAAVAAGVQRFVYASSSAVYGDADVDHMPLKETAPLAPLSPYAASKLANEQDAQALGAAYPEMTNIGLRFFNIFGAGQNPDGDYAAVIPKWIKAMLANQAPSIFGDGSATRDFCHVDNVSELIVELCRGEHFRTAEVFNVGMATETRLSDLYDVIRAELDISNANAWTGTPKYLPWRPGDIHRSVADTTKARSLLGFNPSVDLRSGIRRLLAQDTGIFNPALERA